MTVNFTSRVATIKLTVIAYNFHLLQQRQGRYPVTKKWQYCELFVTILPHTSNLAQLFLKNNSDNMIKYKTCATK